MIDPAQVLGLCLMVLASAGILASAIRDVADAIREQTDRYMGEAEDEPE